MSTPLTPQGFRNVATRLKARGVAVRFYPGWETRGRPYSWGPTLWFKWHHTGSDAQSDSYLKFLFVDGRASEGIPGPLCQFAIRSNGEVWIGASGRANHAGRGSSSVMSKVRAENYPGYSSELDPGPDDTDGNRYSLGVEIMYSGYHKMSTAQYAAAIALAAEINREFGNWTALSNIGHREWSRRKWDPGQHNMAAMRRDTRDALEGGATVATYEEVWEQDRMENIWSYDKASNTKVRPDVNLTRMAYRLDNLADYVFNTDGVIKSPSVAQGNATGDTNPHWAAGSFLRSIWVRVQNVADKVWKTDDIIEAPPSDPEIDTNPHWYAARHLTEQSEAVLYAIPAALDALDAKVDALAAQNVDAIVAALVPAVVDALGGAVGATPEEVRAAVEAGVKAVLIGGVGTPT